MRKLFLTLLLTGSVGLSVASDASEKYSKETFAAAKASGDKSILHFHAEWCPTCRKQKKSFETLETQGVLKGIRVFEVDYDNEKALKKELKVSSQSTLVVFVGEREVARSSGVTAPDQLGKIISDAFPAEMKTK